MKDKSDRIIKWNNGLAYAVGLIATDGNLSPDGRHINLTSKDRELIESFKKCLGLQNKIGRKGSGSNKEKNYYVIQFGDIAFYRFLEGIGISKAKSKTLKKLNVPQEYFFDFLRGCIDGDGCISSTKHPESIVNQLRLRLCSASLPFVLWIKESINKELGIQSGWIYSNSRSMHVLSYAKADTIKILKNVYYIDVEHYLKRKYRIAQPFITKINAGVA